MSSFTQFVPTRMEVGDIAEATLMAIATAPDKRVALELLHTLCREHAISDSDISGGNYSYRNSYAGGAFGRGFW